MGQKLVLKELDESDSRVSAFALVALTALVVGSALAVGTVHVRVLLAVSTVAIVSTAAMLLLARPAVRLAPPAWVLIGLAAWSAMQAIPLPVSVLSIIAPHNSDVWTRALRPFGESPLTFGSISLDPGASLVEALKWYVYAMVFTLAAFVGNVRRKASGAAIVFAGAVAVALVTLGHGMAGATTLFGVYAPELATPRWGMPPILNPNNLSGYLNLGAICGLGILVTRRAGPKRDRALNKIAVIAGIATVVAISVLAASRGGVLGLGFGAMLFALLARRSNGRSVKSGSKSGNRGGSRFQSVAPAWVAIGGGLVLAVIGSNETTWVELMDTGNKLQLLMWSFPLIKQFTWFGIGRGAFESVFPAFRSTPGHVVFTHPENFVVQWIAEWGLPVALGAILLLAWMLRPRRATFFHDRTCLAAGVGVAVLILQNLLDLGLEVPALAIALSTVLGSVWPSSEGTRAGAMESMARPETEPNDTGQRAARRSRARSRLQRRAAWVLGVGSMAILLAARFGTDEVTEERQELHIAYDNTKFGEAAVFAGFRERLREAVLRHPAEPYFPLLGALAAHRTKGANAMPWIGAALERDVMNGRAHLVLAEVLSAKGAIDQALLELRLAAGRSPDLASQLGLTAVRLTHDEERLLSMVPTGKAGAPVLVGIAQALQGDETRATRLRLLDEAVARDADYLAGRLVRGRELIAGARATPGADAAITERYVAALRVEADAVRKLDPASCESFMMYASALDLEMRTAEGESLLARECGTCRGAAGCALAWVRLAASLPPEKSLADAIRAYLASACSDGAACGSAHRTLGDFFAGQGRWASAAEHYGLAANEVSNSDAWLRAAEASLQASDTNRASRMLNRARREGATNPNLERRMEELEREILTRTVDSNAALEPP